MLIPRLSSISPFPTGDVPMGSKRRVSSGCPYPAERPIAVMKLIDEDAPAGYQGRRTGVREYSLSSRQVHTVSFGYRSSANYDTRTMSSYSSENALGEIIECVDVSLKGFFKSEKPLWGAWLRRTCRSDENYSKVAGMLVMIDKVVSVDMWTEMSLDYNAPCRRLKITFDCPRIQKFTGIKRCVYPTSIDVIERMEFGGVTQKLYININEDTFLETIRWTSLPYMEMRIHGDFGLFENDFNNSILRNSRHAGESIALETLREMLTEPEWRRYVKRGFIIVKGDSGKEYQLFRDKWHAKVREKGKIVAEICSRLNTPVPPSDNIIAFKTMIQADESLFERAGNVYRMAKVG